MVPIYINPGQVPKSCAIWDNFLCFQLKNGSVESYDLESCLGGDPFLPLQTATHKESITVPPKFLERLPFLSFKIEKITQTVESEQEQEQNSLYSVSWDWGGSKKTRSNSGCLLTTESQLDFIQSSLDRHKPQPPPYIPEKEWIPVEKDTWYVDSAFWLLQMARQKYKVLTIPTIMGETMNVDCPQWICMFGADLKEIWMRQEDYKTYKKETDDETAFYQKIHQEHPNKHICCHTHPFERTEFKKIHLDQDPEKEEEEKWSLAETYQTYYRLWPSWNNSNQNTFGFDFTHSVMTLGPGISQVHISKSTTNALCIWKENNTLQQIPSVRIPNVSCFGYDQKNARLVLLHLPTKCTKGQKYVLQIWQIKEPLLQETWALLLELHLIEFQRIKNQKHVSVKTRKIKT
jgi:hypothetical protein